MFPNLGVPELILILTIALVVFGPRKLPEIGRSLGKTLNEFRRASIASFNEVNEVTSEVSKIENEIKEEVQQATKQITKNAERKP